MTETTVETAAPAPATPKAKKGKAAVTKKPKAAPSHPPVAQMVYAAIKTLKERGGSSTQAIKKYITSTYKIDAEKKSHFIKKYLVSAVTSGSLVQTKGKGASGSFKLAGPAVAEGKKKNASATKKPLTKKVTTAAVRTKTTKAKLPVKKSSTATPKTKKTKKSPTATKKPKPKVTKAKTVTAPKVKKAPAKKPTAKKPVTKKSSPKKK